MPTYDQMMPGVAAPDDRFNLMQAQKSALVRKEQERRAAERGLWALADHHVPADVREAATRWKLDHCLVEIWRSAFIAGWRASQIVERRQHGADCECALCVTHIVEDGVVMPRSSLPTDGEAG